MAASGNDFIVIDNRKKTFPARNKKLIQELCTFHTGIGADGILLLEKSTKADFKMRIFNPDGFEPDMCGNGARCISLYAWKKKIVATTFEFETLAGIIKGKVFPHNKVRVQLSNPKNLKRNIQLKIKGKKLKINYINTGVPHVIIHKDNLDGINVNEIGAAVRWHKYFSPQGTNVNFVQLTGKNKIALRTYERGVEKETLACGTGTTAAAIISGLIYGLQPPIKAKTKSGIVLEIDFVADKNKINKVTLTGPAKIVFSGICKI